MFARNIFVSGHTLVNNEYNVYVTCLISLWIHKELLNGAILAGLYKHTCSFFTFSFVSPIKSVKYNGSTVQKSLQSTCNSQIFVKLAQAACMRHGCLRAPWVLACAMRSLAIVITIVRSFYLSLLLLTHFGESPVCENLFPPIFWHN